LSPPEDQILAENVPVPSSPVPIATIDLVQAGPPPPLRPAPPRKTRHQEAQEDPARPPWPPGAAPGVSLAFALLQVRELRAQRSSAPPPENQPLQVTSEEATASEDQQPSDSAPPRLHPPRPPRL
ncbi:LOW QUALITY PROTEIN: major facilitator superfamily domain-containing protein 6-A-like, partial [Menidia menidia]